MGNCIRACFGSRWEAVGEEKPQTTPSLLKRPSRKTSGVQRLERDLEQFRTQREVPAGLSQYVQVTKRTQEKWYDKILEAWNDAQQPPATDAQAALLILRALKSHRVHDVQGILLFYKLPVTSVGVRPSAPAGHGVSKTDLAPGVQYELNSLPVDAKAVTDGDTIVCFVDVESSDKERAAVPEAVAAAVKKRAAARANHDYQAGDALHKEIVAAGYRVFDGRDGEPDVLSRKYRIRLRGIDAPEKAMPYGPEAREELLSLVMGKSVQVHVYTTDRYDRVVADIYCNKLFIQEQMLKRGYAWHYKDYDKRDSLAEWEAEARSARVGLWQARSPEPPWEFRRRQRAK